MKYDIVTVGSAVVDAFIDTGISQKGKELCYPAGRKIVVDDVWFATGGGGTNTAVSFSKLGLQTAFLGKLGRDENANKVLGELAKEGVTFIGKQGKEPTGYSVVLDSKEHTRTIFTHKGANEHFSFNDIPLGKLKTQWLYFSSMIGEAFTMQEQLAQWAHTHNIKLAFNPSSYITNKGAKHVKKILTHTKILILNKEEARDLVKTGDLFAGLHALGPRIVCITNGKKGNQVCNTKEIFTSHPNKVKILERTGAGDAFAAGFVAGIIHYNDVQKALEIGSINAESVIQIPGAKNGLLPLKEVKRKVKKGIVKISKKKFVCP